MPLSRVLRVFRARVRVPSGFSVLFPRSMPFYAFSMPFYARSMPFCAIPCVIRARDCSRLKSQISRLYARLFQRSAVRAKRQIDFKAIFKPSNTFYFMPYNFISFTSASAPRSNFAAIRAFYRRGTFRGQYEPPKQKKQFRRARDFSVSTVACVLCLARVVSLVRDPFRIVS